MNPNEETHVTGGRLDYSCMYGDCDATSNVERGLVSDHWALITEIKIQQNQRNKVDRLMLKDEHKVAFVEEMSKWFETYVMSENMSLQMI